jgi:hypothetical protein
VRTYKTAAICVDYEWPESLSDRELVSLPTTRWNWRRSWTQNNSNDFGGELPAFCLQNSLRRGFIFLNTGFRLFDLGLRFVSRLSQRIGPGLQRLLAKCFPMFEDCHASFAQPLLIFRCARFGCGDISASFLNRPFSFGTPLRQYLH